MYVLAFGFSDIGGGEIILVGIVALLLFGRSLPTMSRNFGRTFAQFKQTLNAASSELKKEMDAAASELDKAGADVKLDNPLADVGNQIDLVADLSSNKIPPPLTEAQAAAAAERRATVPAVSDAAALDALPRNIPAPTKIPPPIS